MPSQRTVRKQTTTVTDSGYEITFTDEESKNKPLRVLLGGRSKSGRTTLASTFPNPIFIDFDRGLRSIKERYPVINVTQRDVHGAMIRILEDISNKSGPFKNMKPYPQTLILDDISRFCERMELNILKTNEEKKGSLTKSKLEWGDYSAIQQKVTGILDVLKEAPFPLKYIVVITSLKYKSVDDGPERLYPSITGTALINNVASFFDECWAIDVNTKEDKRELLVQKTRQFDWLGSKTDGLKKMKKIDDPSFDKLSKYLK